MKLLEGAVADDDPQARQIADLEAENRQLRRERDDAQIEADRAREDATRALAMLRQQLAPLYGALRAVFGELDAAGVTEDAPRPASASGTSHGVTDPRVTAVYESWKHRLGGMCAKVIDALLLHGEMNSTQLAIAAHIHRTNVPKAIYKLNQAGLINKNGGRFSLKPL